MGAERRSADEMSSSELRADAPWEERGSKLRAILEDMRSPQVGLEYYALNLTADEVGSCIGLCSHRSTTI